MNKLISDLRNMVVTSRRTGLPIDTERLAAAIAGYSHPYTKDVCTCPSGDGSLRWPCPKHPPEESTSYKPSGYSR